MNLSEKVLHFRNCFSDRATFLTYLVDSSRLSKRSTINLPIMFQNEFSSFNVRASTVTFKDQFAFYISANLAVKIVVYKEYVISIRNDGRDNLILTNLMKFNRFFKNCQRSLVTLGMMDRSCYENGR